MDQNFPLTSQFVGYPNSKFLPITQTISSPRNHSDFLSPQSPPPIGSSASPYPETPGPGCLLKLALMACQSGKYPAWTAREIVEDCHSHNIRKQFVKDPYNCIFQARLSPWDKWKNYQHLLTFYFATKEINKDAHLLPNVTLGTLLELYKVPQLGHALLFAFLFIMRYHFFLMLTNLTDGCVCASVTPRENTSMGLSQGTLESRVTYGTFDSVLSDKDTFPSLYQMSFTDTALTHGVISLLQHFGWKWVGLIVSDDMKGKKFLSDLKAEMVSEDICVAFTEILPVNLNIKSFASNEVNLDQYAEVNVHIFYGNTDDLIFFLFENIHLQPRSNVWIMTNIPLSYLDSVFDGQNNLMSSFEGSFLFSKKRNIPGFMHFLETLTPSQYPGDLYFHKFWNDKFYCSPPPLLCGDDKLCPLNISVKTEQENYVLMIISEPSVSIWNAVYAVAHAIHKMLLRKTEIGFHEDANQDKLISWQVIHCVQTYHQFLPVLPQPSSIPQKVENPLMTNLTGIFSLSSFVPPRSRRLLMIKVGEFVSKSPQDQGLFINEVMIKWPSNFNETPQSTDQKECISCPIQEYPNLERTNCLPKSVIFLSFDDPLGMALTCTSLYFSFITAVVLGILIKYQDSPVVKANNRTLSFILLISLLLCFLCSFLYIGHPSTASCILQQITFSLMFTLALSTVLAKTITVILAFTVMKPGRTMRRLFVSGIYNSVIPICVLIQLILLGVWMVTSPPYIEEDAYSDHSHIIILCNKGSVTAFYCVLAYLGTLALGSFTVAFLARNLPDTFNEAKLLTFSMLVFCSVWVTFLPVYHSTKNQTMVAVEVFSILASTAGLLGCIFFPKCYIILLRPDKNSLKFTPSSSIFNGEFFIVK
ncbi:vomeronasal type-2 receptor 116-like, partial [Sigmodon hispidus]